MEFNYGNEKRLHSKFWGEGKWNNFIEPLLPKRRGVFLELGCNAGLLLKMACDAGFREVYGLEARGQFIRQAKLYQEYNKYPYKIIKGRISLDYEVEGLPVADVVLIANLHYHLSYEVFANLVDRLKNRTRYCIVVAAKSPIRSGKARHFLDHVRGYFKDWKELKVIDDVPTEGDPAYRDLMYSVSFKGGLVLKDIEKQYKEWLEHARRRKSKETRSPALIEFFKKIKRGEKFESKNTAFYKYWMERDPTRAEGRVDWFRKLAEDIKENGMKQPVLYTSDGKFRDGAHRFYFAKASGHKYVLARVI